MSDENEDGKLFFFLLLTGGAHFNELKKFFVHLSQLEFLSISKSRGLSFSLFSSNQILRDLETILKAISIQFCVSLLQSTAKIILYKSFSNCILSSILFFPEICMCVFCKWKQIYNRNSHSISIPLPLLLV